MASTPWPFPRVIAHRGGGALAPENTLAGLRLARKLGFTAVEFDVKLTADRVPVLMHDETLDRTTSGRGPVAQSAWDDIARLDAGAWFGRAFEGELVPDFESAAQICLALGLWANVEIKPCPGREAETGRVVGEMAARLWAGHAPPLLSSFSAEALRAARHAAPDLPRGMLYGEVEDGWPARLHQLGCVSLHCDHRRVAGQTIGMAHDAGYGVLVYTVNRPELARDLMQLGVDAVVTDRLDLVGPGAG